MKKSISDKPTRPAIIKIKIRAPFKQGPGKLARIIGAIKILGFKIRKTKTHLSFFRKDFISSTTLEAKNYENLSKKLEKLAEIIEKESKWIEHVID